MQYLYRDGESFVFMDNESYDQINVEPVTLGDTPSYLLEGANAVLLMYGDEVIGTDIPAAVSLAVTETEPGIQGDRVSGATKPATLETGLVVQVPLFVEPGENVKVDTRSGEYLSRG
jgi:elongation factor P